MGKPGVAELRPFKHYRHIGSTTMKLLNGKSTFLYISAHTSKMNRFFGRSLPCTEIESAMRYKAPPLTILFQNR